jgi:hypothetical protein
MSSEQFARKIDEILRRLDALEATPHSIYAKGTFTPAYDGVTPGTTTHTVQQGVYRRLGDRVDFALTLAWTAATGTGAVRIGGLPFASANVANQNVSGSIYHTGLTFANGSVVVLLAPNAALRLFSPATNAAGTELTVEAAGVLVISGTYYKA